MFEIVSKLEEIKMEEVIWYNVLYRVLFREEVFKYILIEMFFLVNKIILFISWWCSVKYRRELEKDDGRNICVYIRVCICIFVFFAECRKLKNRWSDISRDFWRGE